MISLMMLQGLRVIEVQRLNMADYTPNVWGDQGTLKLHGKGDKHRTVVLRPEMQKVLDVWLKRRELYRPEDDALFVSLHAPQGRTSGPRLQRMTRRAIRARVDTYLDSAGLKDMGVSCHALRHTYATEIVASARRTGQEVDREGIARSMGHSDISITDVYIDYVDMFMNNPSAPLMGILREADEEHNDGKDGTTTSAKKQ
jgi:integrase